MSTTFTLSQVRQRVGIQLANTYVGSMTSSPNSVNVTDINCNDPDSTWDNAYLQDSVNGSLGRILSYAQSGKFTLFNALNPQGAITDGIEVQKMMSFTDWREAVNTGIATCGKSLRTLTTQTLALVANDYQLDNTDLVYGVGGFWPGLVVKIDYQVWTGQPTREYVNVDDWWWLDDETIQLPTWLVDQYAGNNVRATGYGPVIDNIATDAPGTVIGTFDDSSQIEMLVAGVKAAAAGILTAKAPPGDSARYRQIQADSLAQCNDLKRKWSRGIPIQRSFKSPMGSVGY